MDECQLNGMPLGRCRGRGTCRPARKTRAGNTDRRRGRDRGLIASAGEDGSEGSRYRSASTRPVPPSTSSLLQMLRQNRVFDRPEEGRVDAHREDRGKHQRDVREQDPSAADDHDADFRGFDDADEPRLVVIVGELARQREKRKNGRMNRPCAIALNWNSFAGFEKSW